MGNFISSRNKVSQPDTRISRTLNGVARASSVSDPNPECTKDHVPSSSPSPAHARMNEEIVIASIRATDLVLGPRRFPTDFYIIVQHSGFEWRTENKRLSAGDDVVEWDRLIPIPSDLSATVRFVIYAFFDFQPTWGNGEELRKLAITVEQLLDHTAKVLPFRFLPKDGDGVSACLSLLVTVRRQGRGSSGPSSSKIRSSHCSTTECRVRLQNVTDEVLVALLCYRKDGRDIKCSIEQFERALNICPLHHPCRTAVKLNMVLAKVILYKVHNSGVSFDIPLALYYRALSTNPIGHPDRPSILIHLAILHLALFDKQLDDADEAQAVALLRQAMEFSSADSHEKWAASSLLQLHAELKIDPVQPRAGSAIPQGHALRFTYGDQWTLGVQLVKRYECGGNLDDLQQAISLFEELVESTSIWNTQYPTVLQNYGVALLHRFRLSGELGDLEQAISRFRDAIDLIPHGHTGIPTVLNNLGFSLKIRFERQGQLNDLERAISSLRGAVSLTPDGHPNKPGCLDNLGASFLNRFKRLGELSDLERAIASIGDAVNLAPDGHPEKPTMLSNLGVSFTARFRRLGELGDLERAISRLEEAVDLTAGVHPDKPSFLNNLGTSFQTRFERLGDLSDLEQAISWLRGAVDLTPDGHPDKPARLTNLGTSFLTRFEHLGELSDLEQAIAGQEAGVHLTPDGHPDKPAMLNNLGTSFATRFRLFGELSDLEQAIARQGDAVNLTPDADLAKPTWLNNLGISLRIRFEHCGEFSDLQRAISAQDDAAHLTPDGHSDKPAILSNLGKSFIARFEHLGELSDLERAISWLRDAVNLIPDDHPDRPGRLNNLGSFLIDRFERLGELGDLEQAISLYSHSASHPAGPATIRFDASLLWISCARASGHHSLLHAYSVTLGLLPQLAWIGLSLTHRYRELLRGANVVREAAAAALESGYPETAVEWLEQGRSIVWGELFQLRSSHNELAAVHPEHARRLQELSIALEHASTTRENSLSEPTQVPGHLATGSLEQVAYRHRALAIERDKLLKEIRELPRFERFLLHKEFSELRASAHSGPVVILNVAENRCDALIVLADVENVLHVPLPDFSLERSEALQTSMKGLVRHADAIPPGERDGHRTSPELTSLWQSILSSLWKCVVKPVLDSLAFTATGKQSRIFWCPTGPLTFLPIHAAGFYHTEYSQPGHKIFDFVVSSYIPTLSIPTPSPKLDPASSGGLRFLAVRQPSSDGLAHLPGVEAELKLIRAIIMNSPLTRITLQESSSGTVEEVLDLMKDADWVHFACHGVQDASNPTDSGLCLANARRLKLSNIIALSRPRGGLAFLSACQTATGDKELTDEAIHIAAGMLFAGYGGVVGTMWSISDRLAPDVAKGVYEQLFQNGTRPDYWEAARALQNAVGRLREGGASFSEWIPFIHVGL